jgi:hypothetical protein
MEWSVRQHRPATVDQALLLAAEYESFHKKRSQRMFPDRSHLGKQRCFTARKHVSRSFFAEQSVHSRNSLCWYCNTPGYYKKQCRKYKAWLQVHPKQEEPQAASSPVHELPDASEKGPDKHTCGTRHGSMFVDAEVLTA